MPETKSAPPETPRGEAPVSARKPALATATKKSAEAWARDKRAPEWALRAAAAFDREARRIAGPRDLAIPDFRTSEMTEVEFDAAINRVR